MDYVAFIITVGSAICLGLIINIKKRKQNQELIEYKNALVNYMDKNSISIENMDICYIIEKHFEIINENKEIELAVIGKVAKGTINVGDILNYIDKFGNIKSTKVLSIEQFRNKKSSATIGEDVGMKIDANEKMIMLFK